MARKTTKTKEATSAEHPQEKREGRYVYAVGRRKTAVACVRVYQQGAGDITVNGKPYADYFPLAVFQQKVESPLKALDMLSATSLVIKTKGGGVSAQAEAVRHGIARALLKINPNWKVTLKAAGYLRRDPREKERKKYGLKRARRAPQWAKR